MTPSSIRHVAGLVRNHPTGTDVWWEKSVDELLPPELQGNGRTYVLLKGLFSTRRNRLEWILLCRVQRNTQAAKHNAHGEVDR